VLTAVDWLGVSVVVRWFLGWWLSRHLLPLPQARLQNQPAVSVLIPARNEEATLNHLLEGLRCQTLQPLEVIVIDDHSSDQTADVAQAAAQLLPLQLVQPPPLPPGWCGKTWALHNGVQQSAGEVLVFLDADTEPAAELLESLVAQQQRLGGLVSVQPFHRTERLYEQLSLLQAGLPVSAFIGDQQIAYRMYPGGLGDLVVGFDKNFATAAGEVRWPWMLAVVLWLSGLFWAAWCLPASLLGWPLVGDPEPWRHAVVYGAYALQLMVITQRVGRFRWSPLVFPIPVLFFLGVFLMAIVNLERGSVQWKGRSVSTR
jgi:4,4'-diaponeurosporenoate glycosyltransferase